MACETQRPLCRASFVFAVCFLVGTLIFFLLCIAGLDKLPKCRYGENRCFYHPATAICDYTNQYCTATNMGLVKVRIEGSSDSISEQLAIPVIATVLGWVPAVCFFFDRLFSSGSSKALEVGKWFTVGNLCLWMVGIWVVQTTSFDGRWWNQTTQDEMKKGWQLFLAGALLSISCEFVMLGFTLIQKEKAYLPFGQSSPRSHLD